MMRRFGPAVLRAEGRGRLRQDLDRLQPGGATVADIDLMRRTVGEELGVKAAGGGRISPELVK
jgi:hypothetical protein